MSEPDVGDLISVQQAIAVLDSIPLSHRVQRVPLADSTGLRLARALSTDRDYPPFDKSQMDGYAVRRADVETIPADLKVVGEVPAGRWPDRAVGPGEAIAIMTGAPVPTGADGIVPVEDVEKIDGTTIRVIRREGNAGRFIARQASDSAADQVVLPEGILIGPTQIALAAQIGAAAVDVFAPPRVAVLSTGDELVPIGTDPGPSQIRNSNSPMLVALLRQFRCDVTDLGTVLDSPDRIRAALKTGLAHDVLFVTGGMSMGEYDYVPRLLAEIGVDLKITKLRIKPGKPFVFGTYLRLAAELAHGTSSASAFVFGLPGNPVSGFVCTIRLAQRLLNRLAGGPPESRWVVGKLTAPLPANGPREFYQPAIYSNGASADQSPTITPLKWKGSADLFTLSQANALLVRGENEPAADFGSTVRALTI